MRVAGAKGRVDAAAEHAARACVAAAGEGEGTKGGGEGGGCVLRFGEGVTRLKQGSTGQRGVCVSGGRYGLAEGVRLFERKRGI